MPTYNNNNNYNAVVMLVHQRIRCVVSVTLVKVMGACDSLAKLFNQSRKGVNRTRPMGAESVNDTNLLTPRQP